MIIDRSQLTCVPERHQHHQGDQDVEGEGAGHLNICASEPPLVLRDGDGAFIPVLVRRGQADVMSNMDELSDEVTLGPEFPGGGHLDYQHQQSVDRHDDEEHLECLLQG